MRAGLNLAERFYTDAVRPIVTARLAPAHFAAGLVGQGSEVLGLDDARSTDHDWGPRLQLWLPDHTPTAELDDLRARLDAGLPAEFDGHAVRFATSPDPVARHRIEVDTRAAWFSRQLGFDPLAAPTAKQWLGVSPWRLGELVAGRVLHDGPGDVSRSRAVLSWYPDDVWRFVLAGHWRDIAESEAFPGRCAERGDRLGASVITAAIARLIMRIWLLAARQYPPYAKWLGTAFARLPEAAATLDALRHAVSAVDPADQQRQLGAALVQTAQRQNALGLCAAPDATLRPFHDRPYLVIGAERFATALYEALTDESVHALPTTIDLGFRS